MIINTDKCFWKTKREYCSKWAAIDFQWTAKTRSFCRATYWHQRNAEIRRTIVWLAESMCTLMNDFSVFFLSLIMFCVSVAWQRSSLERDLRIKRCTTRMVWWSWCATDSNHSTRIAVILLCNIAVYCIQITVSMESLFVGHNVVCIVANCVFVVVLCRCAIRSIKTQLSIHCR